MELSSIYLNKETFSGVDVYYLFLKNKKDIEKYKTDFNRVKENIDKGKTPVFCELRGAKTQLFESIPYNVLSGIFLVISTIFLNHLQITETIKVAIILVVNSLCGAISNYIFTILKHSLRIKLCKRLQIEASEENIAVMESLEYQSV